ncbi:MAG TPA: c-type cytochrome [Gemmatimonadaceae bacterium]|nr:c-type cytochrome [Gemmatimonadaceae bacterium]
MKALKWIGVALASLVGLVLIVVIALNVVGRRKAASAADVAGTPVTVPANDSALLARGAHLADFMGCEGCHGTGMAGKPFALPAVLVGMAAPNLTAGEGGVGATYTPEDWERAIRHGVAKDGRRLIIMPSEAYTNLNDTDAAALIAYLRTLPPVSQSFPARKIGVVGGALLGAGIFPTVSEMIAHDSVGKRMAIAPGVTAEYGRYLAHVTGCNVCHGADLRGGKEAGGGGPPPGPSLIAFVANNSAEAFRNTIRTGTTPSGRALNPEFMPWPYFGKMTDDELEAIRLYISQ